MGRAAPRGRVGWPATSSELSMAGVACGPVAPFLRFVVCGGGVTLLGSGALLLVGDRAPIAVANAVVAVVTTMIATELHGRVTFRRGRVSWRDHAASGLTVLLSYLFTTGALLAFGAVHPGADALLRQAVYLAASGAAGIARFVLLRWSSSPGRARRTASRPSASRPPTGARPRPARPRGAGAPDRAGWCGSAETAGAPRSAERGAPGDRAGADQGVMRTTCGSWSLVWSANSALMCTMS